MPITQIPFQDPVAPPEKPQPEQLGLYDAQEWESAYRNLDDDARVPHLLIQLQDDLARSRRREAAWISIIVHLILIICLYKIEWFEKYFPWHSAVEARKVSNLKDVTFLELPPDLQKVPHQNSKIVGDKDRIAMTRHPQLDVKELRKMLATPPPGAPGPSAPQMAQPAAQAPQAMAQNQPPPRQQPPPPPQQTAQLQTPPNPASEFQKYAGPRSAGAAIQQATRGVADAKQNGGGSGGGGDFGLGTGAHGRPVGNLEVLSDMQGVDFGPYLQRVLHDVRENWYRLIPVSAEMKKGKLAIEFAIMKDGTVQGLRIVAPSGDVALDRPAQGSITASDPFPPLPKEFGGNYLALRFAFYYNPSKEDLE